LRLSPQRKEGEWRERERERDKRIDFRIILFFFSLPFFFCFFDFLSLLTNGNWLRWVARMAKETKGRTFKIDF